MKYAKCHFCPNDNKDANILLFKFSDRNDFICNQCINELHIANTEVLRLKQENQDKKQKHQKTNTNEDANQNKLPDPKEIFNFLNEYVIGQEEAKKTLAISVAHHYRRLINPNIGKSNILLIGPTGTGKTEIARTIAQFLNVPFTTTDASTLTMKGFMGEDVESILVKLLMSCNWNIEKAERGIVFIDEIDKIARRGDDTQSGSMAVNTTGVQQELLKILEGEEIKIKKPSNKSPTGYETVFLNTKNILFICAGAFVGLDKIINPPKQSPLGLNQTKKEKETLNPKKIDSKSLITFGLIPELLGRLPIVTSTRELTQQELVDIIYKPKNSLSEQYVQLFSLDEVDLVISKEFMEIVAQESLDKKLGARGLRSIFESKMSPIFFNITDYKNKQLVLDSNYEKLTNQSELS